MINCPFNYETYLMSKGVKEQGSYCQEKLQRGPKHDSVLSNIRPAISWLLW